MSVTREQVRKAISSCCCGWTSMQFVDNSTDAVMALLEPPKPPARRWIATETTTEHFDTAIWRGEKAVYVTLRELPSMPSMDDLAKVYITARKIPANLADLANASTEGIRAVIRALGLEPPV